MCSSDLLFVLFGLSPEVNVDVLAHAGGFVTGFLLGLVWVRIPAKWHNSKVDMAAGLMLVGFVVLTCWLAWKN